MSKPAIEIHDLSKAYTISHQRKPQYGTIKDALTTAVQRPFQLLGGPPMDKEKFWALKGISFNVNQGDVVGIVGKNGSGKSTLLKILSRIVEPTQGEVIMRGKVASLLEVGTGFHPELTGRENIYFNGSILGMSRREIESKFNEIVEFSEIEKFLDTPVKFYSSGMYVRLAFAVAAHLEPDILIVDEVLAVGDAEFQKKCIGKMNSVAREGRTVLFVSHNARAIEQLCNKAIWIKSGQISGEGPMRKVLDKYIGEHKKTGTFSAKVDPNRAIQIIKVGLLDGNKPTTTINLSRSYKVELEYVIQEEMEGTFVSCDFYSSDGTAIMASTDSDSSLDKYSKKRKKGRYRARLHVPANTFIDGEFYLVASIHNPQRRDSHSSEEIYFHVSSPENFPRNSFATNAFGYMSLILPWEEELIHE